MEDLSDEGIVASKPLVKIFWAYTQQNKKIRDGLEYHLSALKHQRCIQMWYDHAVLPGMIWEQEIEKHLHAADLFLPVISAYFFGSSSCWQFMMKQALEQWKQGTIHIAPILASSVDCGELLNGLQILPTNEKAINEWSDREKAYKDVASGIRVVVETLLAGKWKQRAEGWSHLEQHDLALNAYEEAIQLNPHDSYLYTEKGETLLRLKRFEEAITAYDEAITLNPHFGPAYKGKGNALDAFAPFACERYKQLAIQSYQMAQTLEQTKKGKKEEN